MCLVGAALALTTNQSRTTGKSRYEKREETCCADVRAVVQGAWLLTALPFPPAGSEGQQQ